MSPTRRLSSLIASPLIFAAAIALLHLILGLTAFHQAPATGGDDATYVSLARSLIERRDYTNIGDAALQPHTQYPPVFAAVVAGGVLAGLAPSFGLRLMMVVISSLAVLVSCLWLRRVASPGVSFCAGFFLAISPEIIRLAPGILSDTLFWSLSVIALLAWHNADVSRRKSGDDYGVMPLGWVAIATAATLLAYFTRSAGAPLLIAVFVWLLLRRQPRALGLLAAAAVPLVLAWWLRGRAEGAEGYVALFLAVDPYDPSAGTMSMADVASRAVGNISVYASRQLSRLALGTPMFGAEFGVPLAAAALYGWTRRIRKPTLADLWFAAYMTLVLLWPVTWSAPRFLLPVVPLIALYASEAVESILRNGTYPKAYAAAILAIGAYMIAPALARQAQHAAGCRAEYAAGEKFPCTDSAYVDFFRTAESTRGRLPEGSVVLARKPTLFYHHSGYRSRPYPMFAEPDSLFDLAERIGARYLVVDRVSDLASRYVEPIVESHHEDFCLMPEFSTSSTRLLRIEPGVTRSHGAHPGSLRVCGA